MKFGIYCEMQTPEGKSHSDMTWEILRQIENADRLGFDVYSVGRLVAHYVVLG